MENKQTIVVDEELLNQIVETKVAELLEKKEKAILEHAGIVIRNLAAQYIKENEVLEKTIDRELNAAIPNSVVAIAIDRKASAKVDSLMNNMYSSQLHTYCQNAIERHILQNSSVVNVLHPLLTGLIVEDSQFKTTLKGHVELALKAKIEKFLNKSTYSLADELFEQFVENYKEKRGKI